MTLGLGLILGAPAREAASAPPVVAGCEDDYPPFCIVDERGQADGFAVELLRASLAAMQRDVTFRTGPWADLKAALAAGEIETLPLVGRTPEREAVFDFTFPYMTLHGAIVVRTDTEDIRNLADLAGREVAVMAGDNAEEFMRRQDPGARLVTTVTFEDALRELAAGRHDAVVIQRLLAKRLMNELRTDNLQFAGPPLTAFKQSFCFAVRDGDRERLALLNEGLALVVADGTFHRLQARWFGDFALPAQTHVVVGGDDNYPPYEFLDQDGRPAGYNVDLTRAIAEQIGIRVTIRLGPWNTIREGLEKGEIDLVHGMFYSAERDQVFDLSAAHAVIAHVAVVRRGDPVPKSAADLAGRDLVAMRGDIMHDYALAHGFADHLSVVDNQEQALRQLVAGRHDVALVAQLPALYWIRENGWDNLTVGKASLSSPEYCYAAMPANRPLLLRFQEGLAALERAGEYRRIGDRWLGVYGQPRVTFADVLKYVGLALAPVLVLLLLALLWSRLLRRQVRQRTAELHRERDLFNRMVEATPVGLVMLDPQGTIVWANRQAENILGIGAETMAGRRYNSREWQVADPAGRPLPDEELPFARVRATGQPVYNVEHAIESPDGRRHLLSCNAVPLRDADGQLERVLVAILDVTQRQEAESRLRESEAALRRAQQMAHIGSWSHDLDCGTTTWSPELYRIFGRDPDAGPLAWEALQEHVHPDDRSAADAAIRAGRTTGTGYAIEFRYRRPDGNLRWLQARGEATREDGRIVRLSGTTQDVTDRHELEDRLVQAEKMRAVGQLAGGIAHDFNNQLGVVLGYADMLTRAIPEGDLNTYAGHIKTSARRAADLTSQLLAFSRKGHGLSADVDVAALIGEVVNILEHTIDRRIAIQSTINTPSAVTVGDPTQLQNVFLNLALNARDAMPAGGTLRFTVDRVDLDAAFCADQGGDMQPGPYLRIDVSDTGCGMTAVVRDRVFEPFFSTKTDGHGHGMGLASAYGTVRAHHGTIVVHSEPDRGATFSTYLPASDAAAPVPEPAPAVARGHARILIVDDEALVRAVAADLLRDLGYEVTTCANANDAFAHYRRHWQEIDLVILDMIMPDMNGRDTFLALRAVNPDIRAIVASGYTLDGDAQAVLDDGAVAFVPKPFVQAELAARVAAALG